MRARSRKISRSVAIAATAISVLAAPAAAQATSVQRGPPRFAVTYDPAITPSYSGRVYVMLSLREAGEPRLGPSWFATEPFYAIDAATTARGGVHALRARGDHSSSSSSAISGAAPAQPLRPDANVSLPYLMRASDRGQTMSIRRVRSICS